jgi:hypothetical protein
MRRPGSGSFISCRFGFLFFSAWCARSRGSRRRRHDRRAGVVTSTRLGRQARAEDERAGLRHDSRSRADRGERLHGISRTCSPRSQHRADRHVGNDVQKTLDLRGFTGGKGVAVFVDGARVNDPRNNGVALEQVPLDGSSGSRSRAACARPRRRRRAGGHRPRRHAPGHDAGSVVDRVRGDVEHGRLDGTYGGTTAASTCSSRGRTTRPTVSGRTPAATRRGSTRALGMDLGEERRLSLSLLSSDLEYGKPRSAHASRNSSRTRTQNVFNTLDEHGRRGAPSRAELPGIGRGGFSLAATSRTATETATRPSPRPRRVDLRGVPSSIRGGTWSGAAQADARGDVVGSAPT